MNNVSFRRRSRRLAGSLAAIALIAGFAAAPASAAPAASRPPASVYIALGDSYAAGTGGGAYLAASGNCLQTAEAYPKLLGAASNLACFGAKTTDVINVVNSAAYAPSLAAASVVTVTVGGNDVGTGGVALACTASVSSSACGAALYDTLVVKLRQLPGKIKDMVKAIKTRAPHARIVLTGYPRLFTVSAGLTAQQAQAATSMNTAADLLNATIALSALTNRAEYVSVTERFAGHGIGSADPWIVAPDGLCLQAVNCGLTPADAFHPTAAGYSSGYAAALKARIP